MRSFGALVSKWPVTLRWVLQRLAVEQKVKSANRSSRVLEAIGLLLFILKLMYSHNGVFKNTMCVTAQIK